MKKVERESSAKLPSVFSMPDADKMLVGGGIVFFGVGCMIGARMMMRREKFMFGFRSEYVGLATKAFMYGTALCVTTFGVGTVVFMKATNINSPKELRRVLHGELSKVDALKPESEIANDIHEKNNMSYDEEVNYWNKVFFAPRTAEEKQLDDSAQREFNSDAMDNEKQLSFWDRHFNKPSDGNPKEKRQSLWEQWTSKDSSVTVVDSIKPKPVEVKNEDETKESFEEIAVLEEKELPSMWEKYFENGTNKKEN
jgi:hypothetical protein